MWASGIIISASLRSYLVELVTFAAIVATMLCVPVMALLAGLFFLVGGSLEAALTFGGALHPALGLVCWWAVGLLPALVYVACMLPPWSSPDP